MIKYKDLLAKVMPIGDGGGVPECEACVIEAVEATLRELGLHVTNTGAICDAREHIYVPVQPLQHRGKK